MVLQTECVPPEVAIDANRQREVLGGVALGEGIKSQGRSCHED